MSVKELNEAAFESEVVSSSKPSVVDFWAPWCGPCRMVGPIVDELSGEFGDSVNFFKVNVDENQSIAAQFGIQGIPTILFFRNGKVVDGQVGAVPKETLAGKITQAFDVNPVVEG